MKLALVFLLVFVTVSYQQQYKKKFYWAPLNHQQDQPSRFQNHQYSSVIRNNNDENSWLQKEAFFSPQEDNYHQSIEPSMVVSASDFPQPWFDQHYYQKRKIQYLNNEASPNISPLFWYMDPGMMNRQDLLIRNYLNPFNSPSFDDDEEAIKSRRRYPSTVADPAQERFFGLLSGSFGGSPIVANTSSARPFFGAFFTKTFVYVTTLVINTTSTPLCILASNVNAAVPCKRRRRGMEIPLDSYVPDDLASLISPSYPEKYEMTAGISSDAIESFTLYKEKNAQFNEFLLKSSKEDVVLVGSDDNIEENLGDREKRQFVVSTTTTLTSYSISALIASTKTISINAGTGTTTLICLPPGLKTC